MRRGLASLCAIAGVLLIAGCGSSSSGSSGPTTTITGGRVSGAVTYHGDGFAISVPSGWTKVVTGSQGHTLVQWSDLSTHSNLSVETLTGAFRSPVTDLESAAKARNRSVPATNRATVTLGPAKLSGTRSAALLTVVESHNTPADATRQLVVTAPDGREYVVEAETVGSGAFTAASADGLAFLRSFTLTGGT